MIRPFPAPLAPALVVLVLAAACSRGGGGAAAPNATAPTPAPSVAASAPASAPASAAASAPASGGAGQVACPTSQPAPLGKDEKRTVSVETSQGTIELAIDGSLSPIATGNFVALAECGYYDGVVFHRLVPGFVIQGGDGQYGREPNLDPQRIGSGGPGYTIKDEPVTTRYGRGTVAMARSSQPDSVGSQFFIVLDDAAAQALAAPQYNNYQIIGTVTSGMDVVDKIAAMPNAGDSAGNLAVDPVAMTKVTVSTP